MKPALGLLHGIPLLVSGAYGVLVRKINICEIRKPRKLESG
jgi:hypothetical protein